MEWLTGQRVPFARSVTGPVVTLTAVCVALLEVSLLLAPWLFVGIGESFRLAFPFVLLFVVSAAVVEGAVPRWLAVPAVPVALASLYTALVLPWNQLSYVVATSVLEWVLTVPLVGDPLAQVLFGGYAPGAATLRNARLVHYGVVVGTAGGAVAAFVGSYRRASVTETAGG